MIEYPYVNQILFFVLSFGIILAQLIVYILSAWVIASWLILFGIITPANRLFNFLTQAVAPIIKPFSWAKIGMLDLAPLLVLMLMLYLVLPIFQAGLQTLAG